METKPTSPSADPRLLRRRRLRFLGYALVALLLVTSLSDRSGLFAYSGDDWRSFNGRSFRAMDVLDGDTFRIRTEDDQIVVVRLLGVDAPDPPSSHWSAEASRYTTARLKDRTITLRLDGTQTRDGQRHLLAYVFITDTDNLNADIIRDGQAYADRRVRHTFASTFEAGEAEARKRHRGLWKDIRDDMQPAWRQDWLRTLRQRRATT
jgi:endonuclease YncB( thermonuclease family)